MTTKTKIAALLGLLVAVNAALLLMLGAAAHRYALLLSTGLLAYGFGLRHAVDADHISAIDNTTRKLMQEGKRPIGVGFFFSLGHSTVVFLLCVGLALSTAYVQRHLPQWKDVGSLVGTIVSGVFLYIIGIINLIVLWDIFKVFRRVTQGGRYEDPNVDRFLEQRGLLGRFFRPWLRAITRSRQMYLVGFLFGLGFDTASEVGVLAIAARSGQSGLPLGVVLLLPLLFAAGMCLIDTLDGVLMLGAYGWAFVRPTRKLFYNLSITVLSVLVAFVVGTVEIMQIVQDRSHLHGPFWDFVGGLDFDKLGYVIIATFAVGWGVAALVSRWRGYEADPSPGQ